MLRENILQDFDKEFGFISNKFEVMDLLENDSPMDYKTIEYLALPSAENNLIWHPGVYFFIGDNKLFRVGVSMKNSRHRVLQHLKHGTSKDGYSIWDIDGHQDQSILLINVKDIKDRHWLLSIEAFFEMKYKPLIKAGRIG